MHYDQDEFYRLLDAVEEQGGAHLDGDHEPHLHTKLTGDSPEYQSIEVKYCGVPALVEVPYEPLDKFGNVQPVQPVKVCLIDDWMGLWPRFRAANAKGKA